MNEIVRYNNDLNEIKLRNFSSMDLDMLMLLCARMKNQKTTELVFSFAELKKSLDIVNKSDKDFLDILFIHFVLSSFHIYWLVLFSGKLFAFMYIYNIEIINIQHCKVDTVCQ